MSLNLEPVHIKSKKKVGSVNSNPVFEVLTTGGLYMNILGKGAGFEVIGTGPHRGVARFISEQRQPTVQWTDLAKSDWHDPSHFAFLLPKYIALTDAFRARQEEDDGL